MDKVIGIGGNSTDRIEGCAGEACGGKYDSEVEHVDNHIDQAIAILDELDW